jgi:RNA polymerase II subunit A-like phosphatase
LSTILEDNQDSDVTAPAESVTSDTPTIDSLVAITQADDPELIAAQTNEQNAVLEAQQVERPLAAAQSALDAKVEELAASDSESEDEELYGDKSDHKTTPPPAHKPSLLRDDDDELMRLGGVLKNVWDGFYDAYKRSLEEIQREKQLSRLEGRGRSLTDTVRVPDIRDIMKRMREQVLQGVRLVFSGVIPLNMNWQKYFLGMVV